MKKLIFILLIALLGCEKDQADKFKVTIYDESGWYWSYLMVEIDGHTYNLTRQQFVSGFLLPELIGEDGFSLYISRPQDQIHHIKVDGITQECRIYFNYDGQFSWRFVYRNNWK